MHGAPSPLSGPDSDSIMEPPETVFIEIEPPDSLSLYTEDLERVIRQLNREKALRAILYIRGGHVVALEHTAGELQRWELALAKLQKRPILLVAAIDGPLCDLSLSLALACDFRLATADACLPSRGSGASASAPMPIWWLASMALHAGALRAQQLLWRTRVVPAKELLESAVVHAIMPNARALRSARLPVPGNVPLALLRRIVLQTFSVSGNDVIGHSLAVSSLVIVDAVGRAASAYAPLPPLMPLSFELRKSSSEWVLTMSSDVRR